MTLSDYLIFTTIAECKTLTLAASKLHLSKSAVSHALAKLEDSLHFPLFYRDQKIMTLTDAGEHLLPYAKAVLAENARFSEQVSGIQGLSSGLIRIGTCTSTCIHWIPDIITSFRAKFPHVELQVRSGSNNAQIAAWVQNNDIDIGIGGVEPSPHLEVEEIYMDEMLCVTSKAFSPANPAYVTAEDIRVLPLILQEGDYNGEAIAALDRLNISSFSHFTAFDDSSLVAMAESGLGYCIEGKLSLKGHHAKVNAFSFHPPIYRKICLIRNKNHRPSPIIREMWKHIQAYVREFPPYELDLG